jgi:hypothetical protein
MGDAQRQELRLSSASPHRYRYARVIIARNASARPDIQCNRRPSRRGDEERDIFWQPGLETERAADVLSIPQSRIGYAHD